MEIAPIFSQAEAVQPLELVAALGAALGTTYVAATAMVRIVKAMTGWVALLPRPALPVLTRAALGLTASVAPVRSMATAHDHRSISPRFETSELPLPPRSLVRAGDISDRTATEPAIASHPAVHGSAHNYSGGPLLPRATGGKPRVPLPLQRNEDDAVRRGISDLRRAHRTALRRGPDGSSERTLRFSHYAVLPGDTLWGIAGKVLRTDDMRAIARYWPRIHRENRDVIGPNPDLLRPGQVLSLPPVAPS